jgi:hypothetical protein
VGENCETDIVMSGLKENEEVASRGSTLRGWKRRVRSGQGAVQEEKRGEKTMKKRKKTNFVQGQGEYRGGK